MKKALICGLVCVFALAATVQADVTLSWTVTPNAATAAGGGSLDLCVGILTADTDVINAIDVGTPTAPGITGTLYQDWGLMGLFPSPGSEVNVGGSWGAAPEPDSHFMISPKFMTIPSGRELAEDCDTSLDSGSKGWGTHLGGTFGLAPAVQAMSMDFVQLYLPTGTVASYAFEVSEAGESKAVFEGTTPQVPEPSMMILLGLGSMAMLLIRRR